MKKVNLFISYSHLDEDQVQEFRKHIEPLIDNGSVVAWYDRKILAGEDFQNSIDKQLENAEIICLFVSANFLSSAACKDEIECAQELKRRKGVSVIPVILSACGWLENKNISQALALPTDGRSIDSYPKSSDGWHVVYEGMKPVIELESRMANVALSEQMVLFLQSTEMLTKAHSKKERVLLDDIFVFPDLSKYDDLREYEKSESSEIVLDEIANHPKMLVAGENQSGKTTLCKKIFVALRERGYFPVYVADRNGLYLGKMVNKISSAFSEQYKGLTLEEVSKKKVVPIIDDFHFAKHKEKNIQELSLFERQVIVVDHIFSMNIQDEGTIQSYTHFKIKELRPSLRNKLIRKWSDLTEYGENSTNVQYQEIDKTTELVNYSLGKVIGGGIMPAYPFFILTVISTSETFGKSLDQEITSQGYCYQALIFMYLRKEGVKNEDIDTYVNYLTELAFFLYDSKKSEISKLEFESFMKKYSDKYNLPISPDVLLGKLQRAQLVIYDSFGNYSFRYLYLFYFFVAKYLSENMESNKKTIDEIIANLHKDENSYVAIFISHHCKSPCLLDEVTLNARSLFKKYDPATLDEKEMKFLDDQAEVIVKEILPPSNSTPEKERSKRLITQDEGDQVARENVGNDHLDNEVSIEIRRSIKTVEVMGLIIKNRSGSLEKDRLELIFEEAMKVHFRLLTSFFELIENHDEEIIDFISGRVKKVNEDSDEKRKMEGKKIQKKSDEDLKKLSRIIYWNTNFFFIYSFLNKIVHSLGSDKLTNVIEKVCDKEGTPAAYLVKHGILMWYNKNLQIDNILELIGKDGFSETAKKVLRFMVVNHCALHSVNYKDKQKIQTKLGIPLQKLLVKT